MCIFVPVVSSRGPHCPLGNDSVQGVMACLTCQLPQATPGCPVLILGVSARVLNSELVGVVMQIALLDVGGA